MQDIPDREAAERGAAIEQRLRSRIAAADGAIGFADFMHDALYAPSIGYYTGGTVRFGAAGDFMTAPEVSPVFGRLVARALLPILEAVEDPVVVELGGGSGALAESMLDLFADVGLAVEYRLLEISPALEARQRRRLERCRQAPGTRIRWIDSLGTRRIRGAIVANEVADALPVDRFVIDRGRVLERAVGWRDGAFVDVERAAGEALTAAVRAIEEDLGRRLASGYASEVCLALPDWVAGLAAALDSGMVLLSDYGFGRREYYAPDRTAGTLMRFRRHRGHADVLTGPGQSDLTAWVDFTALAEAAVDAGLTVTGYSPQAAFLIGCGLAGELADGGGLATGLEHSAAIKTLVLPGEMGERFRFMGLTRGMIAPHPAFGHTDLRHTL